MRHTFRVFGGLLAGLLVAVSPAYADPVTWNLTGSGGEGSWGNVRTFLMGGVTVTATAWGYTYGSSDNALQSAALGQWSTGLGVCNRQEGLSCGSPSHQVDNVGADDFVLFTFSTAVDITSLTIDPYGTWDRDVSYWVAATLTNANLGGVNYAGLAGRGFGARQDLTSGASGNPLNVSPIVGGLVTALLFGGRVEAESSSNSYQDRFKIAAITADVPRRSVPEPTSLLLLGAGFFSLAASRKRA